MKKNTNRWYKLILNKIISPFNGILSYIFDKFFLKLVAFLYLMVMAQKVARESNQERYLYRIDKITKNKKDKPKKIYIVCKEERYKPWIDENESYTDYWINPERSYIAKVCFKNDAILLNAKYICRQPYNYLIALLVICLIMFFLATFFFVTSKVRLN